MPICEQGDLKVEFASDEDLQKYQRYLEESEGAEEALKRFVANHGDPERIIRDYLPSLIDGFTPRTQQQMTDTIRYLAHESLLELFNQAEEAKNDPDSKVQHIQVDPESLKAQTRSQLETKRDGARSSKEDAPEGTAKAYGFIESELGKALDNFDDFWSDVQQQFKDMGIKPENGAYRPQRGGDFEQKAWEDNFRFTVNNKDTASATVKMVLSHMKDVQFQRDENGTMKSDEHGNPLLEERRNYIGMPSFVNLSKAWNMTAHLLSDEFPRTFEHYMDVLEEKGTHNPLARKIAETFQADNTPDSVQQDFVNAFGKHYAKFKYSLISRKKQGGWQTYVGDSDRIQRGEAVVEEWKDTLRQADITYYDERDNVRVDEEKVRALMKEYHSGLTGDVDFQSSAYLHRVHGILEKLGISMPIPALEAFQDGKVSREWEFNFANADKNGIVESVFQSLLKNSEEEGDPTLPEVTPLNDETATSRLRDMAHNSVDYRSDIWAPSFTNVVNKKYYAIQDHERITREIQRVKDPDTARKRLRDPFQRNSPVLQALAGNRGDQTATRESLDVFYLDGLTVSKRNAAATRDNLSPKDQEILALSIFQNNGRDERLINSLTLSDRSRSFALQVPNLGNYQQAGTKGGMWGAEIEAETLQEGELGAIDLEIGDKELSALYRAALSEINRVTKVQNDLQKQINYLQKEGLSYEQAKKRAFEEHPMGEEYARNASTFYLFPLNPEQLSEGQRETIWTEQADGTYKLNPPNQNDASREAIFGALKNWIEQKTLDKAREWSQNEVWDLMNQHYLRKQTPNKYSGNHAKVYAALDYQLSHVLGFTEMMRLFHGDPAQFVKSGDTRSDTIEATLGNFQKRLAKAMGPTISHSFGEEASYNFVTLSDRLIDSKEREQYAKIFDGQQAEGFTGVESTDAQEYTTLDEHVRVGIQYGRIDPEEAQDILDRIQKEQDRGNYDWRLTPEEMKVLDLAPMKPFYSGHRWDEDAGQYVQQMIKSSSFPLVPNLTSGSELDKLRKAMERAGVDRAAYGSAVKVGQKNPVDIFDENDAIREPDPNEVGEEQSSLAEDLEGSSVSLNRTGFGVQFVIPRKKDQISVSTQMNKLAIAGADPTIVREDGSEIDKAEALSQKRKLNKAIMEMEASRLAEELGADLEGKSRDVLPDGEKIKEMVLREAQARNWSELEIQEIKDTTASDFEKPLSFTGSGTKIESLLMSIVTDRLVRRKAHGRSFVQASSAGLKFEDMSENDLVMKQSFDPSTGLNHMKVETDEDGNPTATEPAQIVVPWYFSDSDGNIISMEKFTKTTEDGRSVIDEKKIDSSLLKALGFRIPYQGPNSGLPVEIVGFMDPSFYNLAFVPDEIVSQMGSDFDVDKLNTMLRQYTLDEDGNLTRIDKDKDIPEATETGFGQSVREFDYDTRKALDDQYLDLMMDIARSPEHAKNVLQPLDRDDLGAEKDILVEGFNREDFILPDRQQGDYRRQLDGKGLVGISSLAAQTNEILQQHPQTLPGGGEENAMSIMVQGRDGGTRELSELGKTTSIRSGHSAEDLSAHDAITLYQNAAVDNAKELILGPLGANQETANAIFPLLMMSDKQGIGPDLKHVTRLMRQPIIENILGEVDRRKSALKSGSSFGVLSDVIEEAQAQRGQGRPMISDPEQLLEDLQNPSKDDAWNRRQDNYLEAFRRLLEVNKTLDTVQSAFNFGNRKGPGKNLLESRRHMKALKDAFDLPLSSPMAIGGELQVPNEAHSFNPTTEHGDYAKNSYLLADKLFGNLFQYDSTPFQEAITQMETMKDDRMSEEQVFKVWKEFQSMVYAGAKDALTDESLSDLRKRLLYTTEDSPSLARRLSNARKDGWANDHPFLRFIEINLKDQTKEYGYEEGETALQKTYAHTPDELYYNSIKLDETEEMRIVEDLAGLLSSPVEEKQKMAKDLVLYTMYVQGKKRSPRTFDSLIPPQFFNEERVTEAIENMNLDAFTGGASFLQQYLQNNPSQAPRLTDEIIDKKVKGPVRGPKIEFINDEVPEELTRYTSRGPQLVEYISFFDSDVGRFRLFTRQGTGYGEISTLGSATGGPTDMVEYNPFERRDTPPEGIGVPEMSSAVKITASSEYFGNGLNIPEGGTKITSPTVESHGIYRHHLPASSEASLPEVMDSISSDKEVRSSLRLVAQLMNRIQQEGDLDVNFEVKDLGEVNGKYNPDTNTIVLNSALNIGNPDAEADFAASVELHEVLHALTADAITTAIEKDPSNRTPEERALLQLNSDVRSLLRNQFENFDEYLRTQEELRSGENVQLDQFNDRKRNLFKAGENPHETLVAFFTNPEFQQWANNQTVGKNRNLYEKIVDRVKAFVRKFAETLDIGVQRNSLLERGLTVSTMTIEQQTSLFEAEDTTDTNQGKSTDESLSTEEYYSQDKDQTYEIVTHSTGKVDVRRKDVEAVPKEEANEVKKERNNDAREEATEERGEETSDNPLANAVKDMQNGNYESTRRYIEGDKESLGQSVGEFLSTLTEQERETFRTLRKHIITKC